MQTSLFLGWKPRRHTLQWLFTSPRKPSMKEESTDKNSHGTRMAFHLLLNTMDLAINTCKSANLSSDLGKIETHLNDAKRYYAAVLRHSGRISMNAAIYAGISQRPARGQVCKLDAAQARVAAAML